MLVAICDDESFFRGELKSILLNYKTKKRLHMDIEEFSMGDAFLASDSIYDIVFLDYQMPGLNGMETARRLRAKNATSSIVFITNYPHFAPKAFEVETYRFLEKPINPELIERTVDHYIKQQKYLYPLLLVQDGEQFTIASKDIVYLEADGKYCYVRTTKKTYRSSKTLSQVMALLPQYCFCRIHKSYAINLYCIESYSLKNNLVCLTNGEKALIGRDRRSKFKSIYRDFVRDYCVRL